MRITSSCLMTLILAGAPTAFAVSPPQWQEFAKDDSLDAANVKSEDGLASAYIRRAGEKAVLYEVDCKADRIRVHSDTQRYVRVPAGGGQTVLQPDDGFRTVIPDSRNARIENAVCGIVAQRDLETHKRQQQEECERARHDDLLRIMIAANQLTHNEGLCLAELTHDARPAECDKSGIPKGTTPTQYLHARGIFLECEDHPQ